MLFDGAVAATVADTAQADSQAPAQAAKAADHAAAADSADGHAQAATADIATTPADASGTVVFVDSRVKDADSLLVGVAPGAQVVKLDATRDGLQQIAEYLETHQGLSSVQIIAHGNSGDLWLGNSYLSADNIAQRSALLAEIGNDMAVGGDILIYACNTAEGELGLSFVDSLAALTGRDIAASSNRTGVGGDWDLEIATGSIESVSALSQQARDSYQWGLATITVTNSGDTGAGSLRTALSTAVAGDIITFNSAMTVNLNTQLVITKNLTVDGDLNNDGVADVTLSGQYKTQVLKVNAGVTAELDGVVITKGLAVGNGANAGSDASAALGGGIVNLGNLTLNNVTVTANAASGGGGGGGVTGGTVGGGGGGGGALGGQVGGRGGNAGNGVGYYAGGNGTSNTGGNGGGYNPSVMGGRGGGSAGGAGGQGAFGYSNGGLGGTANNGTISIGGGGGGSGWDAAGRGGAPASGGIYNGASGTLTIIGSSVISNNLGAGGGGGGGGGNGAGASADPGGAGGKGVGAIWNKGTLQITSANFTALTSGNNKGGSGAGGFFSGVAANSPAAVDGIFNDGGSVNSAYNPAPTATILVSNTAQHIGTTSLVTITFSQAVTGFTNTDLNVGNGTLSAVSSADGGKTWTATFTPSPNVNSASNVIVLDNTGVAGASNGLPGVGNTTSNNYSIDTLRPAATSITLSDTALSIGETSQVTITFSEAVSGLTTADFTVANGTLSNLASSNGGVTWTATLTPSANITDSTNVITLDNTGYTDAAGNTGSGTTDSINYAIDTQRPTATIAVADANLTAGETTQVTITFSEAVSGFTNTDLTVPNGSLSSVSSSDGGITWTATFTPNSNFSSASNVITLNNTGVNDLAGNAGAGTTTSNNFSINTVGPTATVVLSDTALKIGETSQVTITFTEAVTGFTDANVTAENGTLSGFTTSDGGVTWTATFTPNANVSDATNVVSLSLAGLSYANGNQGGGSTSSGNYAVDTLRPTATIVVADNALAIGETSLVTITFSEAVTGFSNADLTVSNGTLSAVSSSDGGVTWTAIFTPTSNVTSASNVITLDNSGVADTAGNAGTGTTVSNNYAIDSVRPTASIAMSDTALAVGETSLVTITFSEAVTGFNNADLTIPNGTLSAVSSSDGGVTWTATYTPNINVNAGTNLITLNNTGVSDLAGNAGTGTTNSPNFTIDTRQPTATIVVAQSTLAIGETSLVTITFSEAVTGFTNADLTIANGTLSAVSSSDGGITWTATLTPTTNLTDATNVITLDNTGFTNATGNSGSGTTLSNNYAIDTERPTATIVVADNALAIGETSLVTITFSEAVTGFTLADITVSNGTLSGLSSSDGGITWMATFTPTSGITNASNLITLDNTGVADLAGNAGTGITTSNNYAIDSQRPTATITMSDTALGVGETSVVTITFSEAVTGFTNADLTVANGTLSALSSSDGGITWTATYTPNVNVSDATNLITLDNTGVADLAGNAGVGTTNSPNFSIDTTQPVATIVVADTALASGGTSLVTITFSEPVTGFSNADLSVANGTLSAVSSSDGGITWTATLTPTANIEDTTNVITLNNAGVQGQTSGNPGSGTTDSNNYVIDTKAPTATIVLADNDLAPGETSLVTITFSEPVTGFGNANVTVANGTLSALSSSDGGITWTATLTPATGVNSPSNALVLNYTGVLDAAGNPGSGTVSSGNYAVGINTPPVTPVDPTPPTPVDPTPPTPVVPTPPTPVDPTPVTPTPVPPPPVVPTPPTVTPPAVDPEFLVSTPNVVITSTPNQPLQPTVFAPPTGSLGPALGFAPLFESRTSGEGLPPVGNIFISNGALAPSFVAQVFAGDNANHAGAGGFLGFAGGEGGIFGNSTFASIFSRERAPDTSAAAAFAGDNGGAGVPGEPVASLGPLTLEQQLQRIKAAEHQHLQELAMAFGEMGLREVQA
ncbi:Ig-like domain-containing protein [Pseudomonas sp. DTU_2021_1001937_2_SI_NGA_ILE_001]|uniref:Ig-like domain-containing protein n=1 Tax=Pseudomonas sp. DTU_2021_1001937_2_SI_NGA_ILE_001 TaxID=3077589 RepID=UPI0028FC0F85|nr:Ig-like domain-containing protein [Pseudomonas sp. DTU_2021_1001937_2_SI_NGA_ILE_001]WNW14299.1 Ig-like domain-containing protein [Pseudomonas sp. DTU_2021_1001937_2_SI_NGA_ILE_001]